ncbi:Uncharacterised protein [Vibrio cholerae]|nr:Uncharacterised protein [Vibrio cholerae]
MTAELGCNVTAIWQRCNECLLKSALMALNSCRCANLLKTLISTIRCTSSWTVPCPTLVMA